MGLVLDTSNLSHSQPSIPATSEPPLSHSLLKGLAIEIPPHRPQQLRRKQPEDNRHGQEDEWSPAAKKDTQENSRRNNDRGWRVWPKATKPETSRVCSRARVCVFSSGRSKGNVIGEGQAWNKRRHQSSGEGAKNRRCKDRRKLGQTAYMKTWGQRVRREAVKSNKVRVNRGHG